MGQELRGALSGGRMESSAVNAVGAWFYAVNSDRYLYLMRNDKRIPGSWGLPGGKIEKNETILDAITRECQEELGSMPEYINLIPLEQFNTKDGKFSYHTLFVVVKEEFQPVLNHEHLGYAWIDSTFWPKPMHPGLWSTVNFDVIKDKISTIRQQILNQ